MSDALVSFGPFVKGVNNRLDDHALAPDMLRQAVNVWLTDTGRLKRRQGHEAIYAAADSRSLYATELDLLFASGANLLRYDPDLDTATTLRSDLAADDVVAYTEVNGETFYSSSTAMGRVLAGAHREWGVENPPGLPTLSAVSGAMYAGSYQVVTTFTNGNGEESGAGLATAITLAAGQGVQISGIPQPASAEVAQVNIYGTAHNGDVFYHLVSLPVGATSYTLLTPPSMGRRLKTQFMTRLPHGRVLASAMGRIFSATGRYVFHTLPISNILCDRSKNWLMFPADVTVMAGVKDGLYVVADKTYFITPGADGALAPPREVLPYGGAFGSLAMTPEGNWLWYSDRGVVLAGDGGEVRLLQEKQLSLGVAEVGATLYLEIDGMKQVVSLSQPKGFSTNAEAGSFVDMEVRRKAS